MKVTPLPEIEPGSGPRSVAIGMFDGVHLGHREVIRGADTALTFEPHPLAVIHPEATPKLISPFSVKRDLIAGLGVDELVVIPFDRQFSQRSAEEFVQDVLVRRLGATDV
jgi:riboflavin kinase / FMN adenylyltransferase